MNWKGGLLSPYFSSLIPCMPIRPKECTKYPPLYKREGEPARPGVEKPVPLPGNDIVSYVVSFVKLFRFFLTFLFRSYKETEWSKLIVVDCCDGSGSAGEAALKLGCMYIGNDIDPDMGGVVDHRLKGYKAWQEKPPSFWIAEWRKKITWSIFGAQVPSELDIIEVEEDEEGIFFFLIFFHFNNNFSQRVHLR